MPGDETSTSSGDPARARASQGVSARLFDLWSEIYDLRWVQQLAYRPVHDAVLGALQERPRRAVLDLG